MSLQDDELISIVRTDSGLPGWTQAQFAAAVRAVVGDTGAVVYRATLPGGVSFAGKDQFTIFTVGKTGSGADLVWDQLDAYPDNCLFDLTAHFTLTGEAATTNYQASISYHEPAEGFSNPFMNAQAPLTSGQTVQLTASTQVLMQGGLFKLSWGVSGAGEAPAVTDATLYSMQAVGVSVG